MSILPSISKENISCMYCGEALFCGKASFNTRFVPGYIYILSNSNMPGLLKIGLTTRTVLERTAELNSATGVPAAFTIEAYFESDDPISDESSLHILLAESRVPGREFFRTSLDEAIKAARAVTGTLPLGKADFSIPTSTWLREPAWWHCARCSREFHSLSGWCTQCGNSSQLMNYRR